LCSYSYPLPRRAITTRRFRIYRSVASNDERLAGMSAGRGKSTFLLLRALLFTALSFQRLNNSLHASVRPARSDRLRLFLGLGRCLLCLVRWLRWALFSKDNLSFPRNVGAGDLLSKLLKIEFDIGDSLFQVLCSSAICSFLSGLACYREVDSLLASSRRTRKARKAPSTRRDSVRSKPLKVS
jgi:hypothetical protein